MEREKDGSVIQLSSLSFLTQRRRPLGPPFSRKWTGRAHTDSKMHTLECWWKTSVPIRGASPTDILADLPARLKIVKDTYV